MWISQQAAALLGVLSAADKASKGLLPASKIQPVVAGQGCPVPDALEEALKEAGEGDIDYAKWIAAHKAAGQSTQNKLRAGPTAAPPPSKLTAVKSLKNMQASDTKTLRAELSKLDEGLKREKLDREVLEAEESLRRIRMDELKTPVAKAIIRDAYLTYSPSKKTAKQALKAAEKK